MYQWICILFIVPFSYGVHIRETEYECGAHGRFEYCIDGVPGCVVGCHCHPGYYFDTDTKICEPNIKLTQTYRRNYEVLEPTRISLPTTALVVEEPTTVSNLVDEKIDVITKDADELGDWIYNQFFKTIENQIINETKDDPIISRRSGSAPSTLGINPTRKSHKSWRARRKKKRKKKKKGLKSKLLRITEDDSLFDSSSSSGSDDSSDSSGSSNTEESNESTGKKTRKVKFKNDHGHRKIVVFNKRPKPPLPSFIFLPNMETPFFPPIGLPPPPIPMYPIVPVPPMMGPFPFPAPMPASSGNSSINKVDGGQNNNAGGSGNSDVKNKNDNTSGGQNNAGASSKNDTKNKTGDGGVEASGKKDTKDNSDNTGGGGAGELGNKDTKDNMDNTGGGGSGESGNKDTKDNIDNTGGGGAGELGNKDTKDNMDNTGSGGAGELDNKDTKDNIDNTGGGGSAELGNKDNSDNTGGNGGRQGGLNTKNTRGETFLLRKQSKKRRRPKNKLMQKLRTKIRNEHNYLEDDYKDALPLELPGFIPNHIRPSHEHRLEDSLASLQDVDFKYLSQLIHRADLNKTNNKPPTTTVEIANFVPPPSRRHFQNYPYQITQVLDDLSNQPINHIPETQHAYDSSNQFAYNILSQPISSIPNQPNYNTSNHGSNNMHNQLNYNEPGQLNHNAQKQPNYNVKNQHSYYAFNQPQYNAYNQPNHNSINRPNQSPSMLPNQPAFNMDNQPTYVSLNVPSHKIPYRKKIEDTNDGYYSNLGRQIAAMIRNLEGDKEVDIEIKSNQGNANSPLLATHGGSRSYWERSVRSPSDLMKSYKSQINSLKLSNEDLFSLESKVEIAASTEPTMSLHELENIISEMQKTQPKLNHVKGVPRKAAQPSQRSFNVNLLSKNIQQFYSNENKNKIALNITSKQSNQNNLINNTRQNLYSIQPTLMGSSTLTDPLFKLQASDEILTNTILRIPSLSTYRSNEPSTFPTIVPDPVTVPPVMYKMQDVHKIPNHLTAPPILKKQEPYFRSFAYTALPLPPNSPFLTKRQLSYVQATTSRTFYQQLSPVMLNHKAFTYYNGPNNNQYVYEKSSVPVLPQSVPINPKAPFIRFGTYRKRVLPSSYFHQEVHHFDYFDDIL